MRLVSYLVLSILPLGGLGASGAYPLHSSSLFEGGDKTIKKWMKKAERNDVEALNVGWLNLPVAVWNRARAEWLPGRIQNATMVEYEVKSANYGKSAPKFQRRH